MCTELPVIAVRVNVETLISPNFLPSPFFGLTIKNLPQAGNPLPRATGIVLGAEHTGWTGERSREQQGQPGSEGAEGLG